MKHYLNELFILHNYNKQSPLATKEFCIKNNIPILTFKEGRKVKYTNQVFATVAIYKGNNGKPKKVLDTDGIKLIYLYGEKTFFDTEEELNEYGANGGH